MSAPARVRNWDVALVRFAREVEGQPFRWGRTDCAKVVRRALREVYGADPFPALPDWSTKAQAFQALKTGGGVEEALQAAGAVEVAVPFAQTADVVVGPSVDGEPRTAIVVTNRVLASTRERGVHLAPLSALADGSRLWRLPHG